MGANQIYTPLDGIIFKIIKMRPLIKGNAEILVNSAV
jgi:hypothetical protein